MTLPPRADGVIAEKRARVAQFEIEARATHPNAFLFTTQLRGLDAATSNQPSPPAAALAPTFVDAPTTTTVAARPSAAAVGAAVVGTLVPPTNWDDAANPPTGSYFRSRQVVMPNGATGFLPQIDGHSNNCAALVDQDDQHHAAVPTRPAVPMSASMTVGEDGRLRRKTPAERHEELEAAAVQRVLDALEEQKAEEASRRAACQLQREVERLKLQQRTKARIELQLVAGQAPKDARFVELGAEKLGLSVPNPAAQSQAAMRREEGHDEANANYIAHNLQRLRGSYAHRAYCMEALHHRQAQRTFTETQLQTHFTMTKSHLLETLRSLGGDDAVGGTMAAHSDASTAVPLHRTVSKVNAEAQEVLQFPSIEDFHKRRAQSAAVAEARRLERIEVDREMGEMEEMDRTVRSGVRLQALRRLSSGRPERRREINYAVDVAYVKHRASPGPHNVVDVGTPPVSGRRERQQR